MPSILQKTLNLLLKRQTNILSAALMLMSTVFLSQILGLIRNRLLVATFGATRTADVYLAATQIPDSIFQVIIAGALSSAFIPVFSEYLGKGKEEEAHSFASSLFFIGMIIFGALSILLWFFPDQVSRVVATGFSPSDIILMGQLMRYIVLIEFFFLIASFFSAVLQSYNHFFIPGIAASLYNAGLIMGIIFLAPHYGIFGVVYGGIAGAVAFVVVQYLFLRKIGFKVHWVLNLGHEGVRSVGKLMWPRTLSLAIYRLGSNGMLWLSSFLPGGYFTIFDYAQQLAFAPSLLIGDTIGRAALPVLSRERGKLDEFKATFVTSLTQIFYLVLPIAVLFLVLRIPIVRLAFGAGKFDWTATVLTSQALAFLSLATITQSLLSLVLRGFYALHDTKTTLFVNIFATAIMIAFGAFFILYQKQGIEGLATANSLASFLNFIILLLFLDRKVRFNKKALLFSFSKIILATIFTGFALYVPIKLLDRLVIDTTYTVNLILLTGISSIAGITLYVFLTWLFNVKEAMTFILIFQKIGNWREILEKSTEVEPNRIK